MAKVITVSRTFPAYHPKAGQPTYFVEKILNAMGMNKPFNSSDFQRHLVALNTKNIAKGTLDWYHDIAPFCGSLNMSETKQKIHTIRAGNRWKQGEKASLRVWSGSPYRSPQIVIAPDVELVEVYDFEIAKNPFPIGPDVYHGVNSLYFELDQIAQNDGLSMEDFLAWFKYPQHFEGQILAWRPVNYV